MTWVHSLRSQWLGMRAHEHTPLAEIRRSSECRPRCPCSRRSWFSTTPRWKSYSPVRRAMIAGPPGGNFAFEASPTTLWCFRVRWNQPPGRTGHHRRRIADEAAGRMLEHLRTLLLGMITNPHRALQDLPILPAEERHRLLFEWNDTVRPLHQHDSSPVCSRPRSSAPPRPQP